MSTNTTSTNNGTGNGASKPKSSASKSAASAEGARYYPFGAIPLPDPERWKDWRMSSFLHCPRILPTGTMARWRKPTSSPPVESEEIPTVMFTEEMLPVQQSPLFESSPGVPASPPSSPPGPLTESDLRAIAASLAGAMALVPGAPGTAPLPPVAGSPPRLFRGGE